MHRFLLLAAIAAGASSSAIAAAQTRSPDAHAGRNAPDATAPTPAVPPASTGHAHAPAQIGMDHQNMDHGASMSPAPDTVDHSTMNHGPQGHAGMDHGAMNHDAIGHAAMRPFGPVAPEPYARAAVDALAKAPPGSATPAMATTMGTGSGWYQTGSGTARLPAGEGPMRGAMLHAGDWMLMGHGYTWPMVTDQGGPRGRTKAFVQSMAMLMANRPLGDDAYLQTRAMLSLEPAMGRRGYPNLFATGETAFGQPLIDRQHPHDLFMELSARIDHRLGAGSVFLYGGPVAEPALGPSAFMHRASARYTPLSPITHHWFDSTHITYGVVTAGVAQPRWQIEASAFKGQEPDEERWGIDRLALNSWSVRATWSPNAYLVAQASYGYLKEPEAFHPNEDERRTTASVQYASAGVAATLAYSRKDREGGRPLPAWLAEATWELTPRHAVFGRVENVVNDELFPDHDDALHDRRFRVTKFEGGYAYRLPIVGPLGVALGGSLAAYAKPDALDAYYGRSPVSWTLFGKFAVGL